MAKKHLGHVDISAWAGVDDGGIAKVEGPVVEVNRKEPSAPNMKHISRVLWKRFSVTEDENPEAYVDKNRMISYEKEIVSKQTDGGEKGTGKLPFESRSSEPSYGEQLKGDIRNPLTWAKNMLDNHENRFRDIDWKFVIVFLMMGILAASVIFAFLRLSA